MTSLCNICRLLTSRENEYCEDYNTVLFESDNFIALPTKSPIVEGWVLIFSKKHYLSMADVPNYLLKELEGFTDHVKNKIEQYYSSCIIVEQGPIDSGLPTGCGVDHAHLHIIPMDVGGIRCKVNEILGTNDKNWINNISITSLPSTRNKYNKCYFFLADNKTQIVLLVNSNCKRTTSRQPEYFMRCPVVEALPWSII